ncbi:MAG: hypothetical protein QOD06_1751 [Candidatus Binatota bacterium]|jgi:plastocyanin|nr:hypothetical protein [Candidatus Binatota bacterium]
MKESRRRQIRRALGCGITVLVAARAPLHAGSVIGKATIDGSAVVGLIALESTHPAPAKQEPRRALHAVMDQKNLTFIPPLLPIVAGTVVEFTNSDDVQHNVFSPSEIAGKFDLGTYGPGAVRSITFSEPGEARVLCNIHMEMEARILVLKEPHFSVVSEDGRYEIRDVPAGEYVLKVWAERWLPFTRTVAVTDGRDLTVDVIPER